MSSNTDEKSDSNLPNVGSRAAPERGSQHNSNNIMAANDNRAGQRASAQPVRNAQTDETDVRWETMIHGLLEYQNVQHTLNVPRNYRWDGRNLYEWTRNQRKHYLNGTRGRVPSLLPKRIDRLRSIGFVFDTSNERGQNDAFDDTRWVAMFEGLKKYHRQHGTFSVPLGYLCDGRSLYEWLRHQRKQYSITMKSNRTALSVQRIARLQSIGFDIDPTGRRQDSRSEEERWEVMVEGLLKFKKQYGTFQLPEGFMHDGRNLFSWAHNQRRLYANLLKRQQPSLLPERIERLGSIGFDLTPRMKAKDRHYNSKGNTIGSSRDKSKPPPSSNDNQKHPAVDILSRSSPDHKSHSSDTSPCYIDTTGVSSAVAAVALHVLDEYQRMTKQQRLEWLKHNEADS